MSGGLRPRGGRAVPEGANVDYPPLSVFRIGNDGTLTFVRKDDIDAGGKTMFWMGMVQL